MLTPKQKRDLLKGAILGWLSPDFVSANPSDTEPFLEKVQDDVDRMCGQVDAFIDSMVRDLVNDLDGGN